MYEECEHCHLFIEENYTDGDPELAPYVHLDRGDEADALITEDHDAAPSGQVHELDWWRENGPVKMIERFED